MKSNQSGGLCLKALLLLTIAITLLLLLIPTKTVSVEVSGTTLISATSTEVQITPLKEIEEPKSQSLEQKQVIPKILSDISWCESRNDQSKIGLNYRTKIVTDENGATSSVRYVWSRDIGKYQINDFYHLETAKKLGIDIYTVEGNTQYALLLYNKNGTRDWNPSRECWTNIDAWKAKEKSFY